jgi:hypothetical protein
MSQCTQIQNIDGTCGVDLIGKFESLEEDFRIILQKIGFTRIVHIPVKQNVSNKNGSDIIALERKSIMKLNELGLLLIMAVSNNTQKNKDVFLANIEKHKKLHRILT